MKTEGKLSDVLERQPVFDFFLLLFRDKNCMSPAERKYTCKVLAKELWKKKGGET